MLPPLPCQPLCYLLVRTFPREDYPRQKDDVWRPFSGKFQCSLTSPSRSGQNLWSRWEDRTLRWGGQEHKAHRENVSTTLQWQPLSMCPLTSILASQNLYTSYSYVHKKESHKMWSVSESSLRTACGFHLSVSLNFLERDSVCVARWIIQIQFHIRWNCMIRGKNFVWPLSEGQSVCLSLFDSPIAKS